MEEFIKEATKRGLWGPVMRAVTQSILNHPKMTGLAKTRDDAIRQASLASLGYPDLFNRSMADRLMKKGADPTFIRINDPLHERFWTVDPCLALSQGGSFLFISHLPAEPCELKVSFSEGLYMVAYAIPAFTDIQLPDGRRLKGAINFPDAISVGFDSIENTNILGPSTATV